MPRTYTFPTNSKGHNQRWTPAHTKQAKKMVAQGMTYQEIGERMGFSGPTVARYAPRSIPKPREWTPEEEALALQMRKQGATYRQIAQELGGISGMTVGRRIKTLQANEVHKQHLPEQTNIVPPRRIMNSASREPYTQKWGTPTRPGAMDYANVRSRGF